MSYTLTVTEMKCTGCEDTVTDAVGEIDGVSEVTADHEADRVTVEGDADEGEVRDAIEGAGFEVAG
ncbi:heavy-metal-associated domain-containing protein [Natronorarus salvus]|uniref:heavy-metal-associated domain-containing protein n=1 Tax=Natronorarus salvus TaxID=3117733 RepID=UPI002F26A6F6